MQKDSRLLLQDMLVAARKIVQAAAGWTADELAANDIVLDSVLYNFIVLGEAANRVPAEEREQWPAVPWRSIIDMRNVTAHAYDSLSLETIAQTINVKAPVLITLIEQILKEYE